MYTAVRTDKMFNSRDPGQVTVHYVLYMPNQERAVFGAQRRYCPTHRFHYYGGLAFP